MSCVDPPVARLPPILHVHADLGQWIAAAVSDTVGALQRDLEVKGHARLLVSGGTTPAPVYDVLSEQLLDWAKVGVALVDERWLPAGDANSNARLLRETLLTHYASAAHFQAMLTSNRNLRETVIAANQGSAQASVALLGMGPDGHTASLFPHMHGLEEALKADVDYVEVDASGCPGAGPWPRRISITPTGLAKTAVRLLLIRGAQKRELIQRALDGTDAAELPVRAIFALPGEPLHIHWCP